MEKINYVIQDELGIHARPAGMLAKEAGKFQSDIKVQKDDKIVDGKRIFGLMSLGVQKGDKVTVSAEGPDEADAILVIEEFLKRNL